MAATSSVEPEPGRFFVDTNIVGYIASLIDPLATDYLALISGEEFADRVPSVATVVVAELDRGLQVLDLGTVTQRHLAVMTREVLGLFEEVGSDAFSDEVAVVLQREAIAVGHPIGAAAQSNDLEIAALVIRYRAPLISHNYTDFVNIHGLDLRTLATVKKDPPRISHQFG